MRLTRKGFADSLAIVSFLGVAFLGFRYLLTATLPQPPASPTTIDRAFTNEFLQALRLAVIVIGAFVAGALVQRVILGLFQFQTRWGGLPEIPVAPIVFEATQPIRDEVQKVTQELERRIAALETETEGRFETLGRDVIQPLTKALATLEEEVAARESKGVS